MTIARMTDRSEEKLEVEGDIACGPETGLDLHADDRAGNRRALADKTMKTAITVRLKAGKDLVSPICIYSVAEAHRVRVIFNDIHMEGMSQRGSPPRIHPSGKRPLSRRAFNGAHELGHHLLGHGSSIDELRENQLVRPWDEGAIRMISAVVEPVETLA